MARPDDTQASLIARALQGDRAAFDALAASCRQRLATLVEFRLGEALRREVEPDDVLQETYLRAFRAIERFTPRSDDSFFRWLSGIARNVILERCRHTHPAGELRDEEQPAGSISPSGAMRRQERLERLQGALAALPPDYRLVLRGVLVEKLPVTEVALRMGRTPNAVSLLLLRANRKLRESFGDTQSLGLPAAQLDWGDTDADDGPSPRT